MSETAAAPKYHSKRHLSLQDAAAQPTRSSSAPPPTLAIVNAAQFDSSSVAVTALVLLSVLCFLGFVSVYARRYYSSDLEPRRHAHPGVSQHLRLFPSAAPPGLDPAEVRALPLLLYDGAGRKGDASPSGCDCVVCLGEFDDGEVVRVIPSCGHLFHPHCIDSWLLAHASCPLCRSTELFASDSKTKDGGGAATPAPAMVGEGRSGATLVEIVVVGREGGGAVHRDGEPAARGGGGGGMGRSRSWCGLVAGEQNGVDSPRRSCSV